MIKRTKPPSQKALVNCAYAESLDRLDRHVEHIPVGWQRLYGDLRHALRLVATSDRMDIEIHGAWEEDGFLRLDSSTSDPVIQGVLRKARTRATHTCSRCGRPGRRRELANWEEATLCGSCAAPLLLCLDIERVLSLEKCGSLDLHQELQWAPETVLIRAAGQAMATVSGLQALDLEEMSTENVRAWLEALRAALEEELLTR